MERLRSLDEQEALELAVEAYVFLYPLVTMDITRRQMTNIEPGKVLGRGPMMTFTHVPAFPPAEFRDIVRPNFDTHYSIAWLDLTEGPVVVSVPDSGGRYYLLPHLDMWTDVFPSLGARTTGTGAGRFAVVLQGWTGPLPEGARRVDASTPYVWIIGRTQTNGPADYEAVHAFQNGLTLTPLAQSGEPAQPKPFEVDPRVDMQTAPMRQVNQMAGPDFFVYAAELMRLHPPHVTDQAVVARMRRLGLEPGHPLDRDNLDPVVQKALLEAPSAAQTAMTDKLPTLASVVNGWQMNTDTMGVYGNYYLKRAIVAMVGLGANQVEDATYPMSQVDGDGRALDGTNDYVIHFDGTELPPVRAFWSVTLYDNEGFQVANGLDRFAIGDRDPLTYNADGSLDLYIQHTSPGPDKEPNWLPAPAGPLSLTARLYWPRPQVLDGSWSPPPVRLAG